MYIFTTLACLSHGEMGTCLLADSTASLSAIRVVRIVDVHWDDEMWKLPVDEHAQRWQTEENGEKSYCMHGGR